MYFVKISNLREIFKEGKRVGGAGKLAIVVLASLGDRFLYVA